MKYRALLLAIVVAQALMIGALAYAQESHAWGLWAESFGEWHKISKIKIEDKCFYIIEGWTKNGNGLAMSAQPAICPVAEKVP